MEHGTLADNQGNTGLNTDNHRGRRRADRQRGDGQDREGSQNSSNNVGSEKEYIQYNYKTQAMTVLSVLLRLRGFFKSWSFMLEYEYYCIVNRSHVMILWNFSISDIRPHKSFVYLSIYFHFIIIEFFFWCAFKEVVQGCGEGVTCSKCWRNKLAVHENHNSYCDSPPPHTHTKSVILHQPGTSSFLFGINYISWQADQIDQSPVSVSLNDEKLSYSVSLTAIPSLWSITVNVKVSNHRSQNNTCIIYHSRQCSRKWTARTHFVQKN